MSLSGLDERGQRVWLGGLHARPAKVYLFVPDPREEDRGPGGNGSA